MRIKVYNKNAIGAIAELVERQDLRVIGFEGEDLSYDNYLRLRRTLRGRRLRNLSGVIEKRRLVKDPYEIERMVGAIDILNVGFDEVEDALVPGRSEKEVAACLESSMRRAGADGIAFETIVASGWRGALPHGKASDKKIRRGELVIIDMGVYFEGYNSDQTRVYVVGSPTSMHKKIFNIVRDAHDRAIERIRPGVKASEVDDTARSYIARAGYGRYFGHGTGHGIGLKVHEGPVISPMSKDVLEEGMVFTIEPGIYIPEWGGIRIEDMVVVTSDGCDILTKSSRELHVIQ